MKKKVLALTISLIIGAFALAGCGGSSAQNNDSAASDTSAQSASGDGVTDTSPDASATGNIALAVGEAILSSDSSLPDMTVDTSDGENAELNFTSVCDAEYDRVEAYYHAYATDGMAPEISVIQVKDASDVVTVMSALNSHLTDRTGTFESYAPDQVELVENAVVTYVGNYVALFISEKSTMDKSTFEEALEKNGIF